MSDSKNIFLFFYLLLFFWVLTIAFPVEAASSSDKVVPWDSNSAVRYREPPKDAIDTYRQNRKYNYDDVEPKYNFIEKYLIRLLDWLARDVIQQKWIVYLFGGLISLGLLFFVLKFLKIPVSGLFSFSKSSSGNGLAAIHPAEELSSEELEDLFQLHKNEKAYREAIRVLYLIYLKNLHQRGVISLQVNKTNREYAYEIQEEASRMCFKRLSRLYDYVWYGQFNVATQEFLQIEKEFDLAKVSVSLKMRRDG